MDTDPNTSSGSRWEPNTVTAGPPPPVPVQPVPVQEVKPARRLTGPILAGALGLAVLTGAGGFALGYAVSDHGVSQDKAQVPGQGQFPGGRQRRGQGRLGTPPNGQDGQNGQDSQDGQSNGQGT
jgi:hypothetical protein